MTKIITPHPQSKSTKELEFQNKRVIYLAKEFIKHTHCRHCGEKKDRKVVPLYEFGDPYLPSQVNIYCAKCKSNEVFALRPSEEAIAFAKFHKTGELTEVRDKPIDTAEDMIDYAKYWNAAKLATNKLDNEVTKDEKGEIIANPDKVKKIDEKIAKKKKK